MTALSEELKREIIREEPGGLWFVLSEETASDTASTTDLLFGEPDETQA